MASTQVGLSDFLVRLAIEPHLFAEYNRDPSGVMERENLAGVDRPAVLMDDLHQIRDRLRTEHPDVDVFHVVMEPGPPKPPPPEPEPEPEPEPKP